VGASHAHLGEVPVIYVLACSGAAFSSDVLLAHCRERLSGYKVPAAVHLVDAIPRTGSGKIMRFKLLEAVE
jgi:long-chain acyl-CoA synthetase